MPLFNQPAAALQSATSAVDVGAATAPTAGQVLTANSATDASWASPPAGSLPSVTNQALTTTVTSSSTTDVAPASLGGTGLSIAAPAAGNYLCQFSCQFQSSSATGVVTFSIYVNGVKVAQSERGFRVAAGGANEAIALSTYLTGVAITQAIDVRWRQSTGTGTITNRELIIMRAL